MGSVLITYNQLLPVAEADKRFEVILQVLFPAFIRVCLYFPKCSSPAGTLGFLLSPPRLNLVTVLLENKDSERAGGCQTEAEYSLIHTASFQDGPHEAASGNSAPHI